MVPALSGGTSPQLQHCRTTGQHGRRLQQGAHSGGKHTPVCDRVGFVPRVVFCLIHVFPCKCISFISSSSHQSPAHFSLL